MSPATAANRGLGTIITPDRDFDDLAMLHRIDPVDAVARLRTNDDR